METQHKPRRYYHGSYLFGFLLLIIVAIVLSVGLFAWLRHNLWESVIPYTVETTIVANSQSPSANSAPEHTIISPFTFSQEIIVNSDDLDMLYQKLEEHIDGYLSFAITLLSIVFAVICVMIPIYNYFFLQKDSVELLRDSANSLIQEAKEKEEQYKATMTRLKNLSEEVKKAEDNVKEIQQTVKTLHTKVEEHQTTLSGINKEFSNLHKKQAEYPGGAKSNAASLTKTSFSVSEVSNTVPDAPDGNSSNHSSATDNQNKENKFIPPKQPQGSD